MSFVKLIESSSDARLQSSGADLNLSEGYERSIIREDTAKKSGAAAVGDFISNQFIKLKEDKLSVEDLNKEYGVSNALVFDEPEYPSVAKRKRENKISDITRQSILAAESFDNGFIQKGSLLAHSLGVGIATDPFTLVSGGLGALGLAGKGAGVLAKTAGLSKQYQNTMAVYNAVAESKYVQFTTQAFDKAVNPVFNRLARGNKVVAAGLKTAAAANVENMVVEPFVYKQAKDNGYDYDLLQSAAIQIGFSGVAGVVGAGATALARNSKFKNLTVTNEAFKKQSRQMYNYSKINSVNTELDTPAYIIQNRSGDIRHVIFGKSRSGKEFIEVQTADGGFVDRFEPDKASSKYSTTDKKELAKRIIDGHFDPINETWDTGPVQVVKEGQAVKEGGLFKFAENDVDFEGFVDNYSEGLSTQYGVNLDPGLVKAVIQQESAFDPNARSGAGAQGLMQLMPGTAKDLGVKDVFNPFENAKGGMTYLAQQLKTFNGDKSKALAAYNWGPGNVQKAIKRYGDSWLSHAPDETKNYVRRITKDFNTKKKISDASAFLGKVTTNTDDFSTNVSRASAYLDNAVRGGKISKKAYTELTLKAMDDAYADNAIDLDYVYATLKSDQDYHAKNAFFNDLDSGRYDAYLDDSQKIDLASNPDASNLRQHRFKSWIAESVGLQKLSKAIDDIDGTFKQLGIKTRTLKAVELKSRKLQTELTNLQKEFTKTQKKIEIAAGKNNTKAVDALRAQNLELQNKINRIDSDLTTSNSLRNQVTGLEADGYYKQALENDPAKLDFESFRNEFKELQANLKAKKVPDTKNFANMANETKAALARLYHLSNFDDIDNINTKALVDLDDVEIETAYLDHKFKQELDRISEADARDIHRKNIENPYYKQDRNADDLLVERDSDYFEDDYIDDSEVKALTESERFKQDTKMQEEFEVYKKTLDEEEALERVELEYAKCLVGA